MKSFRGFIGRKRGFTIVELVVVIAIAAILAAVLIPAFSSAVKQANRSVDIQTVRNLNSAILPDRTLGNLPEDRADLLKLVEASGFSAEKIQARVEGNAILWDEENECFCYYDADSDPHILYFPEINGKQADKYWVVQEDEFQDYNPEGQQNQQEAIQCKHEVKVYRCNNNGTHTYVCNNLKCNFEYCTEKCQDNMVGDSCSVCGFVPIKALAFEKQEITLTIGETKSLTVNIEPEKASNKTLLWITNDESIVSVTQKGEIKAEKTGKITISVWAQDCENSTVSATITVNVTE